jgi:hypothetical protein
MQMGPGNGLYEIYVGGGTNPNRVIMSCRADGYVDLWERNDNSGRQIWKLTKLNNGLYNIEVGGGTNDDK